MHLLERDIILESSFVSAFEANKIACQRITETKFQLNILRNNDINHVPIWDHFLAPVSFSENFA